MVVSRHGLWAEVALNRPHRRNAIVARSVEALGAAFAELAADSAVAAVVLRGEGGVFCSGMDLKEPPAGEVFRRSWVDLHRQLSRFPVPLVGALERAAVAGGASLALACDLLVVGEGAFLQVSEVEMGRPAPMNVAWLVFKHGPALGLQAVLSARRYSAAQLLAAGVAHEVVADAEVLSRSRQMAQRVSGYDRATLVGLKQSILAAAPRSFEEVLGDAV